MGVCTQRHDCALEQCQIAVSPSVAYVLQPMPAVRVVLKTENAKDQICLSPIIWDQPVHPSEQVHSARAGRSLHHLDGSGPAATRM